MKFTPRQREIIELRSSGQTFKEIAYALNISLKTVEYHWHCIQTILGIYDVVAICRWWWVRMQKPDRL